MPPNRHFSAIKNTENHETQSSGFGDFCEWFDAEVFKIWKSLPSQATSGYIVSLIHKWSWYAKGKR